MLNVIVFVCGAALMGLELLATRVLAPALGNSLFVWGSVISIVMIALSLGYWLGGHLADRWGAGRVLAPVIAGAGLLTVVAPALARPILPLSADLGPRAGSLVAAASVFFLPAMLLATVSPLAVSVAASRGLERIGRSTGGLYAVSTAGSILGTIGTSFWLIPLLSVEPLIVSIGYVLLAASVAALVLPIADPAPRRSARVLTASLCLAGLLSGAVVLSGGAPALADMGVGERVVFRRDTQYHRLSVTEDSTTRRMRFDKSNQTAVDIADPYTSRIRYPDYMHLALAVQPRPRRVLVLGLGGGSVSKRYWRDYPEVTVDSVEIDPVVVDVARRYFDLPDDPRMNVVVNDARRFVQTSKETYDIVIIDAYYDDALPFHLTTKEFLTEVRRRLAPGGVVAYNMIGSVSGDGSRLFRSMYRTAGTVWPRVWAFPIGIGADGIAITRRNIIVLATDRALTREQLLERIAGRVDGRVSVPGFASMGADLYTGRIAVADVPVLTDSYAPTDSLIQVQ